MTFFRGTINLSQTGDRLTYWKPEGVDIGGESYIRNTRHIQMSKNTRMHLNKTSLEHSTL